MKLIVEDSVQKSLDPENEDNSNLPNVRNYLPIKTVWHFRKCPATPWREPQVVSCFALKNDTRSQRLIVLHCDIFGITLLGFPAKILYVLLFHACLMPRPFCPRRQGMKITKFLIMQFFPSPRLHGDHIRWSIPRLADASGGWMADKLTFRGPCLLFFVFLTTLLSKTLSSCSLIKAGDEDSQRHKTTELYQLYVV